MRVIDPWKSFCSSLRVLVRPRGNQECLTSPPLRYRCSARSNHRVHGPALFFVTYTLSNWVISNNVTYMIFVRHGSTRHRRMTGMTILRDWRSGRFIFLCWLVLEDTIRKHFGNSLIIFLLRRT